MIGVGKDFIRVDQLGYRVSATGPDGATRWSRTFADSAFPSYLAEADLVDVRLADASHVLVDPHTGDTKLSCGPCTVSAYPTAWRSATPAMRASSTSTGSTTASSSPSRPTRRAA